MNLYEHKLNNGFSEHFKLGEEDGPISDFIKIEEDDKPVESQNTLSVILTPYYERETNGIIRPCSTIKIFSKGELVNPASCTIDYYFDEFGTHDLRYIALTENDFGWHNFKVVVNYKGEITIASENLKLTENSIID